MKITKDYAQLVNLLEITTLELSKTAGNTNAITLLNAVKNEFNNLLSIDNEVKVAKSKPAKQVKAPAKPKVSVSDSVKVVVRSAELDNEVIVATLTNLKDWGTRRQREAGSVENLTAKQLNNVINTWVKHRKDEVLRATKIDGFKADLRKGLSIHTLSQNFVIAPTEKILEVSI